MKPKNIQIIDGNLLNFPKPTGCNTTHASPERGSCSGADLEMIEV